MSPRRFALLHTTAFRWIAASAAMFAAAFVVVFGFIYWQSAGQMRREFDRLLLAQAAGFATQSGPELLNHLHDYLAVDPRQMRSGGVFDADGRRIAGNLVALPPALPPPGRMGDMMVRRLGASGHVATEYTCVLAQRLPGGRLLVLGRNMEQMEQLDRTITRALLLGAGPALLLALAGGVAVSLGTVRKLEAIHAASRRIMAGQLSERLPVGGGGGDFDKVAGIVNVMLDEIERLMHEAKDAGDAIAHDLRTPLARLRGRLERARDGTERDAETLRADIDGAMVQLDELIATMQALLRLGAIEQGQRQAEFAPFDPAETAREVGELYAPMADDRGVALAVEAGSGGTVFGDHGLLFEAMVNLVDNAIKFTPAGGHVRLLVRPVAAEVVLSVTDDGPGIAPAERAAVLRRFFRADRSRHAAGTGLGLSLVAAIARLHGYGLEIGAGPDGRGCRATLRCPRIAAATAVPVASRVLVGHG